MALALESREIRKEVGLVTDAEATELWTRFGPAASLIASRLFKRTRSATFFALARQDLIDVGRYALCEAWARYLLSCEICTMDDPGFGQWARRVVRWRVVETIQRTRPEGMELPEPADASAWSDSHEAIVRDTLALEADELETEDYSAAEVEQRELREWLRSAVNRLPGRQAIVVIAVMHGESFAEVGRTLGLQGQSARKIFLAGLERLRKMAARDGVSGLGTDAWLERPLSR